MSDGLRNQVIDISWRINTKELERANAETDAVINKASKAEDGFAKTAKSVDSTTSSLKKSAKGIDDNSEKVVEFGRKSKKNLGDTEKSAKETADKVDKIGDEFDETTSSAKKFGSNGSRYVKGVGDSADESRTKIDRLSDASEKASGRIKSGFDKAKLAVVALTAVSIVGAKAALNASSDYEESLNKVDAVFDRDAASVKKWSDSTIKGIGLASATALDLSSGYGDMATSMGINSKEAATMSMTMVDLAADLASFKNKDIDQINTALNGVFTGEGEALKSLGVIMTQSQLEQYALAKGYTSSAGSAAQAAQKTLAVEKAQKALNQAVKKHGENSLETRDAQSKLDLAVEKANESSGFSITSMKQDELVRLRYNFLLDKTKNAQGDFANNLDSVANSERVFQETTKQSAKVFGDFLAPVYVKMLRFGTDLLEKTSVIPEKFEAFKMKMKPFYEDTVEYLGGVKDYFVDELIPSAKDLAKNMGPGFLEGASDSLKLLSWTVDTVIKPPLDWLMEYSNKHPERMKDVAKWSAYGITGILGFSIVSGPIFAITKKVNSLRRSIEKIGDSAIVSAGKAKLGFDTMEKSVPSPVQPNTPLPTDTDVPVPAAPVKTGGKLATIKKGLGWTVLGAGVASKLPSAGAKSLAAESALLKNAGLLGIGGKISASLSPLTTFLGSIGGAKGFAKAIPGLSYLSAGANLIGINKENAAEKVGGSAGQLGGGGVGALIGTFIAPGVGTAIGGVIGTFVGDKLGENLSKSIKDNWPVIKESAATLWDFAKGNIITGPLAEGAEGMVVSAKETFGKVKESFKNPLDEEIISTKDGKVNKESAKAVNRYVEEDNKVSAKLDYIEASGAKYTKEDSEEVIASYDKMQEVVQDHIDSARGNSKSDFDKLVEAGVMSEESASTAAERSEENWKFRETQQKQYHDELVKIEEERASKIEKSNKTHEDQINAIKKKALEENRQLTSSENDKIIALEKQRQEEQAKIMEEYNGKQERAQESAKSNAVMTLSASAQEQMIILGKLSNSSEEISAKQAQGMIKSSYSAKEETIKNAEKQYNETKSILENKLYVTGEITQAEYDEALANAKKMKEDTVAQAEEQHQKVIEQATERSEGLKNLANTETGETLSIWGKFKVGFFDLVNETTSSALSTWDSFKTGLQNVVNVVIRGINKPLAFFGIKQIPEWASTNTANTDGTRVNYGGGMLPAYHAGDRSSYAGPALVGEEGVELAYSKASSSMRLLGSNGPEVANIASSERILSHKETMSVLNGGLGAGAVLPGFSEGKGGKIGDVVNNVKEIGTDLWDGAMEIGASAMEWLTDPVGKVKALIDKNNSYKNEPTVSGFGWGTMKKLGEGATSWVTNKASEIMTSFSSGAGAAFGSGAFAPRFGGGFTMTSDFGNRAALFGRSFHNGMDFAAPLGTPLVAQHPGIISHAGYVNSYGNLVAVNVAKGMHTLYGHMQSIAVKTGQAVARGGLLGTVGSTGDSTGPHVHYELKKGGVFGQTVDPKTYGQPAETASSSPTGYKNGGWITKDGIYRAGEDGDKEVVIPVDRPQRAMELIGQALDYLGVGGGKANKQPAGAKVSKGQTFLSNASSPLETASKNVNSINNSTNQAQHIEFKPEVNVYVQGGSDDPVEARIKKAVQEATEEMFAQFAALFPKGVV